MSDFDKEAEREKLREKYEHDQEKRKATQRMSELLLKGATMTNRHCDACGDPIFRYDGQEFCPTCQNPAANAEAAEAGDEPGAPGANGAPTSATDDRSGAAESSPAGRAAPAEGTASDAATADAGDGSSAPSARTRERGRDRNPAANDGRTPAEEATPTGRTERPTPDRAAEAEPNARADLPATVDGESGDAPAAGDDLDAARASLRRVVTRYSAAAERADDPRRATELLAAAREAAETLAALRR